MPMSLKAVLAFTRIPGNAFSFAIRHAMHWSRGKPNLVQESKQGLFGYLNNAPSENPPSFAASEAPPLTVVEAEAKEKLFLNRYDLKNLSQMSSVLLYRKTLYLLDILEQASQGLSLFAKSQTTVKALDIGAQDWHYVFALERWLRHAPADEKAEATSLDKPVSSRQVSLTGIEVDGYGIYPDFHSRRDYAVTYAEQTQNAEVAYVVGDFLKHEGQDYDVVTLFYPFVTRYQLLLWGLPLRFFKPQRMIEKAAQITKFGGCFLVFTHSQREHALFLELGHQSGHYALLREGPALSGMVDFYRDVSDRHYSVWRRLSRS
jgi:hypothetical protein